MCFELYIYLKVHLQQRNPPPGRTEFRIRDSGGKPVPCIRWTDTEWESFKNHYQEQVNNFWDSGFKLITPSSYTGLDWPTTGAGRRRRNVACHFRLILNATPHNVHAVIPVVRVASTASGFRSHSMLYDDRGVNPDTYRSVTGRIEWSFFSTIHEVGHLLGLWGYTGAIT